MCSLRTPARQQRDSNPIAELTAETIQCAAASRIISSTTCEYRTLVVTRFQCPRISRQLEALAEEIGQRYPHGEIPARDEERKQTAPTLRLRCPNRGYVIRCCEDFAAAT